MRRHGVREEEERWIEIMKAVLQNTYWNPEVAGMKVEIQFRRPGVLI